MMIGVEHRYNPNLKGMLSIGLCCLEDVTLPQRATYSSHIQSQTFVIVDDFIFTEQQTSEMGHIALTI